MSRMRSVRATFGLLASGVTAVAAVAFVACSSNNSTVGSGSTTPDSGLDATDHDASMDSGGYDSGGYDAVNTPDSSSNEAGSNDAGNEDAGNEDAGNEDAGNEDAGNDAGHPHDAGDDAGDGSAGCTTNAECNGGADGGSKYCNFGDNLTENYRATCPSTGKCTKLPKASTCPSSCNISAIAYCGCSGMAYSCPCFAEVNGDTVRYEDPGGICH
jgi:hypothetical protein